MTLTINDEVYKVYITRKDNKHTYIRVKEDLGIYVTTNIFTSDEYVKKLIHQNIESIFKMIERQKKKAEKNNNFYLFGVKYDVVLCNIFNKVVVDGNKIYTKNLSMLDKYKKEEARRVFNERLNICYNLIKNKIPYPKLNIRRMRQKWGYCNKRDELITLNLELIKYDIDEIDYVIIHELCHFIHFNHSQSFWEEVKTYKPNYKKNRKVLREE